MSTLLIDAFIFSHPRFLRAGSHKFVHANIYAAGFSRKSEYTEQIAYVARHPTIMSCFKVLPHLLDWKGGMVLEYIDSWTPARVLLFFFFFFFAIYRTVRSTHSHLCI